MRLSRPEWSSGKRCSRVRSTLDRIWHRGNSSTPSAHSWLSSRTWAEGQSQNERLASPTYTTATFWAPASLGLLQFIFGISFFSRNRYRARSELVSACGQGKRVTQGRGEYGSSEASQADAQGYTGTGASGTSS